jgi:hypothetical protein
MKRRILGLAALLLIAVAAPASAQLSENLGALSGDNAKKYLEPLQDALSGTMNSAIFTSGSVPKAGLTFQIGIKAMGVTFGDDDKTFTPSVPSGFTNNPVSTAVGNNNAVAQTGPGGTTLYFPGGLDIGEFMLAVPQATIGSVMGTRAVVRYITVDLGDSDFGKVELFGIGAQHSVSQYLPGLPVDLALGLFYQQFKIDEKLLDTSAFHVGVTGSKSFGILQPYGELGFDTFSMSSEYEASGGGTTKVEFDGKSNVHVTAGLLANLAFVKLHGELNVGATTGAAVGLSFGL